METTNNIWLLMFPDATVTERIKEFRDKFPDWKILPEIMEFAPDWIVMKAVNGDSL